MVMIVFWLFFLVDSQVFPGQAAFLFSTFITFPLSSTPVWSVPLCLRPATAFRKRQSTTFLSSCQRFFPTSCVFLRDGGFQCVMKPLPDLKIGPWRVCFFPVCIFHHSIPFFPCPCFATPTVVGELCRRMRSCVFSLPFPLPVHLTMALPRLFWCIFVRFFLSLS